MKTNRKKQAIILCSLLVGIICLTVGFASFTSSLSIKSTLTVNPNAEFAILFSDSNTVGEYSIQGISTNSISGVANNSNVTVNSGIISNGIVPTISNLGGTMTDVGQTITYTFYIVNISNYDASLTNITFNNATGGSSFKNCVAANSSIQSEVDTACNNISVKVDVGEGSNLATATNTSTEFSGNILSSKSIRKVIVTIKYEGTTSPSGAFSVAFGDINIGYIQYSGSSTNPEEETTLYTIDYGEKTFDTLSVGDVVSIGTQEFMYVSKDTEYAYIIAKYNLNVGDYQYKENNTVVNDGIQDEHVRGVVGPITDYCNNASGEDNCTSTGDYFYGGIPFDTSVTSFGTSYTDISDISVYTINNYLSYYKTYLSNILGDTDFSVILPNLNIFTFLGLDMQNASCTYCNILNGVSFWTSTVGESSSKLFSYVFNYSSYLQNPTTETLASSYILYDGITTTSGAYQTDIPSAVGVRPVIVIPLSKLG